MNFINQRLEYYSGLGNSNKNLTLSGGTNLTKFGRKIDQLLKAGLSNKPAGVRSKKVFVEWQN